MSQPILNKEKFTLTLGVSQTDVDLEELKDKAQAEGFEPKEDFHITLIGFKPGKTILEALEKMPNHERIFKGNQIQKLIDNTDWSFEMLPKKYHLKKEYQFKNYDTGEVIPKTRESYVQMIELKSIADFYEQLNKILRTNLEIQLPHLTLYTKGTDPEKSKMGIGINSEKELNELNPQQI